MNTKYQSCSYSLCKHQPPTTLTVCVNIKHRPCSYSLCEHQAPTILIQFVRTSGTDHAHTVCVNIRHWPCSYSLCEYLAPIKLLWIPYTSRGPVNCMIKYLGLTKSGQKAGRFKNKNYSFHFITEYHSPPSTTKLLIITQYMWTSGGTQNHHLVLFIVLSPHTPSRLTLLGVPQIVYYVIPTYRGPSLYQWLS